MITTRVWTMTIDLITICKARPHWFLVLILELDWIELDEIRSHEVSLDIGLKHEKIGAHIFEEALTSRNVTYMNMTQSWD